MSPLLLMVNSSLPCPESPYPTISPNSSASLSVAFTAKIPSPGTAFSLRAAEYSPSKVGKNSFTFTTFTVTTAWDRAV